MIKENAISVFGLGKLGCSMLACLAQKDWQVIGVDINDEIVRLINEGKSPVYEPGVDQMIAKNHNNIFATNDYNLAITKSNVSFIIVPTPSDKNGCFLIDLVENVIIQIAKAVSVKNDYHLIVVTSTVLPGDMNKIISLFEETSGKKVNTNFGVCYNPDFIALGTVVKNLLNPDIVLIGESDEKAGSILQNIHERLTENKPSFHRMSFYNAELTKIALNAYCTLKITFANILAEICENIPGGDVDLVTRALGSDTRIGHKYLKGGLSYGGPCFPRDNLAFSHSAKKFGINHSYAAITDKINLYHKEQRIPNKIIRLLKKHGGNQISILGITYKPDTNLIEESAVITIILELLKLNFNIKIYDPAGVPENFSEITDSRKVTFSGNLISCLKDTDFCFIATPWEEFKTLKPEHFINNMRNPVVLDAWNYLSDKKSDQVVYYEIGKN